MIAWGINALNHGSSLALFKDGRLLSNQVGLLDELDSNVITDALHIGAPDRIFWYERPWIKKARQLYAGQWGRALDMNVLPRRHLKAQHYAPITYTPHHGSHAAAGYYTSPFNHCAVVVLDAIGEFECATIWNCMHGEMKKVWTAKYPHSLGLFYSAFTQMLGLTPIRDEHLLQKMAAQGDPKRFKNEVESYFKPYGLELTYNFHRGVHNWDPKPHTLQEQCDIAAAVQAKFSSTVHGIMFRAKDLTKADSLVYMGGCAMNSDANKEFEHLFKYRWSLPNPGDPSSAMGAVLYHTKTRVRLDLPPIKHMNIKV